PNLTLLADTLQGHAAAVQEATAPAAGNELKQLYHYGLAVSVPVVLDGQVVGAYQIDEDLARIRSTYPLVFVLLVFAFAGLSHVIARAALRRCQRPADTQSRPPRTIGVRSKALPAHASYGQHLTRRELDVLRELASSHSYHEIAGRLIISEETVRTHVKSILHKLGQPDRTQAIVYAVQMGILEL
ncbi:MAG: response regulator transcription factor, partial [Chloroflexi bacterium]|nr:response regulator transcription factor [Chloroflexota bacterium]